MWAGGKSRLVDRYGPFWPMSDSKVPYVEPFFGGGAMFCAMVNSGLVGGAPGSVVLGDVNRELVGLLAAVTSDLERFLGSVSALVDDYLEVGKPVRKAWFYQLRERYWEGPDPATLYVLMKLAFNGIWQTCRASNGLFGTPAGLLNHERATQVFRPELVRAWSAALSSATLHAGSFETVPVPQVPSLIFLDPPYRDSFTSYATSFGDDAQETLAGWFRSRVTEGHRVLLANRCVDGDRFFEDLIGDVATFHYFDVTYTAGRRKRVEAGFEAKQAREFLAVSNLG
jgi:DNA adenine methylase